MGEIEGSGDRVVRVWVGVGLVGQREGVAGPAGWPVGPVGLLGRLAQRGLSFIFFLSLFLFTFLLFIIFYSILVTPITVFIKYKTNFII